MLGPLEVVVGEEPVALTRGARELLAVLLIKVGSVVPAEAAADALWGDDQPGNPQAALHTQVSRLRDVLEPDRRRGEPAKVVVTRAPGYSLVFNEGAVDAEIFRRLVEEASAILEVDPTGAAARCALR